jgi:hypothetical protein
MVGGWQVMLPAVLRVIPQMLSALPVSTLVMWLGILNISQNLWKCQTISTSIMLLYKIQKLDRFKLSFIPYPYVPLRVILVSGFYCRRGFGIYYFWEFVYVCGAKVEDFWKVNITKSFNVFSVFCDFDSLLRCNLHPITFAHVQCIIQWFLVNERLCSHHLSAVLEYFHHSKKIPAAWL